MYLRDVGDEMNVWIFMKFIWRLLYIPLYYACIFIINRCQKHIRIIHKGIKVKNNSEVSTDVSVNIALLLLSLRHRIPCSKYI